MYPFLCICVRMCVCIQIIYFAWLELSLCTCSWGACACMYACIMYVYTCVYYLVGAKLQACSWSSSSIGERLHVYMCVIYIYICVCVCVCVCRHTNVEYKWRKIFFMQWYTYIHLCTHINTYRRRAASRPPQAPRMCRTWRTRMRQLW